MPSACHPASSTFLICRRTATACGGALVSRVALLAVLAWAGSVFPSSSSFASPTLSVLDFGAKGDGRTDDTKAFAAALRQAVQRGVPVVTAPAGSYRLEGHLEIPRGIALTGSWQVPHHSSTLGVSSGTVILAFEGRGQEDGPPLIGLNENSAVRGLTIYYPEQTVVDIVAYPWTFRGRDMHCTIENVTLVNSYQAIDFGTHAHELHMIRNVYGVALRRGVWVDRCTDIGRIENVHFNPHYWARSPWGGNRRQFNWNVLMDYLVTHGEAFIFGRSDWEYVHNTFCYGYRVGYKFVPGQSGIGTNGNFLGIGADGGNIALLAEAANPYGLLVTNGEFVAMRGPEPTEIVTGKDFRGVLHLNNCAFWGPAFRVARLEGPGTVSFHQCNFQNWDKSQPAILAGNGVLNVSSSRFQKAYPHVLLRPEVRGAVLMGNLVTGGFRVENQTRAKVELLANVDGLESP